jgi:hypothetical protein
MQRVSDIAISLLENAIVNQGAEVKVIIPNKWLVWLTWRLACRQKALVRDLERSVELRVMALEHGKAK